MKRRACIASAVLPLPWGSAGAATAPASHAPVQAWESTFLKALEGKRENLMQFVRANWFAMDDVAIAQGLMTSYHLLTAPPTETEWDVMVLVSYPQAQGYSGIVEPFERIRTAHQRVLIEGKGFPELGRIVRSVTWQDRTAA